MREDSLAISIAKEIEEKKALRDLVVRAKEVRKYCYTPYSHFNVGAAILTKSGKVYTGCNIENATFSPTICAERVAISKAVSEGEKEFKAIAIIGGKGDDISEFCAPCGVCRQVMAEFCDKDFKIILTNGKENRMYTLEELLPLSFTKNDL